MNFTDFTLDGGLQEGLAEAGYITCMPVQEQVLKIGLEGADLYVQSQTGTGKTAAYLCTILQRLVSDPALSGKKALIMVPTRELAVQVEEEAHILGSCMKLKSASFYGGVGYGRQIELLKEGMDIIIGTPGRVIDLQESGQMDLSKVAFLVIDEADRMFDMGFYPDLRTLIRVLPKSEARQTMLFSATLNASVKNLAWEYTNDAKEITIEAENVTVDEIDQLLFHVSSDQKMKLLLGLLKKETPASVIVFCNTKRMSEIVSKRLRINGYEADFIIGDLPQSKRLQVIDSFKSGSLKMLVATDVAARGIDVDSLAMVINYDLPNEAENYVHRIGRTARAGKTGKAYSFCSEQDVYNLPAIEKYIENKVPSCVPGEEDFVEDQSAHVYIRTDRYDSDYADDDGGYRGGRSGGSSRDGRSRDGRSRDGRSRDSRPRDGGSRDGRPSSRSGPRTGERRNDAVRPTDAVRPAPARPAAQAELDAGDTAAEARAGTYVDRERSADARGRGRTGGGHFGDAGARTVNMQGRGRRNAGDAKERDLSRMSFEERMSYYKNKYGSEEAARAAAQQHEAIPSNDSSRAAGRSQQDRDANRGKERTGERDAGRPGDRGRAEAGRQSGQPRTSSPQRAGQGRQERGQERPQSGGQNRRQQSRPPAGTPNRDSRGPAQGSRSAAPYRGNPQKRGESPAQRDVPVASAKKGGLGGLLKKLFKGSN